MEPINIQIQQDCQQIGVKFNCDPKNANFKLVCMEEMIRIVGKYFEDVFLVCLESIISLGIQTKRF